MRLLSGLYFHPLWSPNGKFIVYSEDDASGGTLAVKAITPEKDPFPFAKAARELYLGGLSISAWSRSPGGAAGRCRRSGSEFLARRSGNGPPAADYSLRATAAVHSFDISSDGKSILFERTLENADLALIERPAG